MSVLEINQQNILLKISNNMKMNNFIKAFQLMKIVLRFIRKLVIYNNHTRNNNNNKIYS